MKRIYVHKDIYQEFIKEMVEYTKNLKVGNGMDKDVFMGPIQNSMQYERVMASLFGTIAWAMERIAG